MKIYALFLAILVPFLPISNASAQDGAERQCLFDTAYSWDYIELGCRLKIVQPAALMNISEVGFDHHPRGYYRHCWNHETTEFQVAALKFRIGITIQVAVR